MESHVVLGNLAFAPRIRVGLPYAYPTPQTKGTGILAGEFPDGITTVEGTPVSAQVLVRLRTSPPGLPGDGHLVAETTSSNTGEWLITGVDSSLKYDVSARLADQCDALQSDVTPHEP